MSTRVVSGRRLAGADRKGVRRRGVPEPATGWRSARTRYAEWGGPIGKRRSFWWFAGAWTAFMATCAVVGLERGGW